MRFGYSCSRFGFYTLLLPVSFLLHPICFVRSQNVQGIRTFFEVPQWGNLVKGGDDTKDTEVARIMDTKDERFQNNDEHHPLGETRHLASSNWNGFNDVFSESTNDTPTMSPIATTVAMNPPSSVESAIPLVRPIRDCTATNPCGRCEGDCDNDSQCMGDLVCFQKEQGQSGVHAVGGCLGDDTSRTDWCTLPEYVTPAPSTSLAPSTTTSPSHEPSESAAPSRSPSTSTAPTQVPTLVPSHTPTASKEPSQVPTNVPSTTTAPSRAPSISTLPSLIPSTSQAPSLVPSTSLAPSQIPTSSAAPSQEPTASASPSMVPSTSSVPSQAPSISLLPSQSPTRSNAPSLSPSTSPSPSLIPSTSIAPSQTPSDLPSAVPSTSISPTQTPSTLPTQTPSVSISPSENPSTMPTTTPSTSASPSQAPSTSPTMTPTLSSQPTTTPSDQPTVFMGTPPGGPGGVLEGRNNDGDDDSDDNDDGNTTDDDPIPLVTPVRDCSSSNPCGRCEGDCDNDSQCSGTLVCFQKGRGQPGVHAVGGCLGDDLSRTDWCTKPEFIGRDDASSNEIPLVKPVRNCTDTKPCKRCEGDCDSDAQCEGSLICYQRGRGTRGVQAVPGCIGHDLSRTDWCTLPMYAATAARGAVFDFLFRSSDRHNDAVVEANG